MGEAVAGTRQRLLALGHRQLDLGLLGRRDAGAAEDDHRRADAPVAQDELRLLVFQREADRPQLVAQQEVGVLDRQAKAGGGALGGTVGHGGAIRMARNSLTLVRVGPVTSRSPSRANTE